MQTHGGVLQHRYNVRVLQHRHRVRVPQYRHRVWVYNIDIG